MISYNGIQDVLTAILVIIVVSVVVALAWLSTNVREQPLVATAVVVFQSGVDSENGAENVNEQSQRETQGSGANEGETSAEELVNIVKDNKTTSGDSSMEAQERSEGAASSEMCLDDGVEASEFLEVDRIANQEPNISGPTPILGAEKTSACVVEDGPTPILGAEKTSECVVQDVQKEECSRLVQDTSKLPSPPESPSDESPEMEVRRRRLQQFISMGENTSSTSPLHSSSSKSESVSLNAEANSTSSTTTQPEAALADVQEEVERPPGSIKIRLKFLDETQRFVFAQPTEQIGRFKRQHFSIEMDANRRIRLIFNGQLLSQDTSTLAQCGLFDNCVVHCHVSQPQANRTANQVEPQAQEEEDAYVRHLLAPLLYLVMGVMWYLRYGYGHLFNTMSTVILLFLTALLLFSTYLLYITQNVPEARSTAQVSEPETRRSL